MRYLLILATSIGCLAQPIGFQTPSVVGSRGIDRNKLWAWYTMSEGSGQRIANRVLDVPTYINLVGPSERLFSDTHYFSKTAGLTITADTDADPNGTTNATHIIATAGDREMWHVGMTYGSGAYTASVWAKTTNASPQTFRLWLWGGALRQSGTLTCNNTWAQYSYTATPNSSANGQIYITTDASNNAYDIEFYGLQVQSGSSATAYEAPKFHQFLGDSTGVDAFDTSWTNSAIYCASNQRMMALGQPVLLTNMSVYALVRWSRDPFNAIGYDGIASTAGTTGILGVTVTSNNPPSVLFNNNQALTLLGDINRNAWSMVAGTYDGATLTAYVDGVPAAVKSVAGASVTTDAIFLSNFNFAGYWPGEIAAVWWYTNISHSAVTVINNLRWAKEFALARGLPYSPYRRFIIFEGDSITEVEDVSKYPYKVQKTLSPIGNARIMATGGSTISDVISRASSVDALMRLQPRTNIVCLLEGYNDLGVVATNQWWLDYTGYLTARRKSGWKVVACTILPATGSAGWSAARNWANAALRANPQYYDALADLAADPTIGCDNCWTNTTYFNVDGVHPKEAGHNIIAPIVKAAIESL